MADEESAARYLGRPHVSKVPIRIAAHEGRREDVAVHIGFEDRVGACLTTAIEGEDETITQTDDLTHTGLHESDLDDIVADAIESYDAQS